MNSDPGNVSLAKEPGEAAPLRTTPTDDKWLWFDSGRGEAAFNMALDEALLQAMPRLRRPVLRFYGWTESAASFGYFQKYSEIEQTTLFRPLVRRPTGGGLVPHNADWTYSLAFPTAHRWYSLKAVESYRRVHEWIQSAFARLNVPTELALEARKALPGQCFVGYEKSDVLWRGKKIAGAAQRRTRAGLLIQGSVQPPPIPVKRKEWQLAMREVAAANAEGGWATLELDPDLSQAAENLALRKYSQPGYNRKR